MLIPLVRFFTVLALLAFFATQANAQTPTLTFTVESTRGVESVVPKLTWATTPVAASCTASWATAAKAGAGTDTLAAITSSKTYSITCTWPGEVDADLKWVAPTKYTDNVTPLTVAKYTFNYGTVLADVMPLTAPAGVKTATLTGPATSHHFSNVGAAGTYYFCVRAWDSTGVSSACGTTTAGDLPSKVITGPESQTRSLAITVDPRPMAPTGLTVE